MRVALGLALEQRAEATSDIETTSVGRGTRFAYLRTVLEPLRSQMDQHALDRAVAALAVAVGIEAQIVLRDLCHLDDDEVEDVVPVDVSNHRQVVDGSRHPRPMILAAGRSSATEPAVSSAHASSD
ncbi:MAG: hypothetical protein WD271_08385 [Acidimicrobiia bacterium]